MILLVVSATLALFFSALAAASASSSPDYIDLDWLKLIGGILTFAFGAWAFVVRQIGTRVSNSVTLAFKTLSTQVLGIGKEIEKIEGDFEKLVSEVHAERVLMHERVARLEEARKSDKQ